MARTTIDTHTADTRTREHENTREQIERLTLQRTILAEQVGKLLVRVNFLESHAKRMLVAIGPHIPSTWREHLEEMLPEKVSLGLRDPKPEYPPGRVIKENES